MLVINANNQQNTTNYMLADPQYPDVNQILMRGGPSSYQTYNISNSQTVTTYDVPVVETIGTTKINYYCPKIYIQGLLQGNRKRTDRIISTGGYIRADFGFIFQTSSPNYRLYLTSGVFKYTIAVKGLKGGQIVGENIIAPIGRVAGYSNNFSFVSQGILHVEFALLHSDGTTTNIASGDFTKMSLGNSDRLADYGSNQVSTFGLHMFNYNGAGQTAQDGDILIATVSLLNASGETTAYIFNQETGKPIPQGIIYGNAFNMNIRDPNGFRPFQVSIRDS